MNLPIISAPMETNVIGKKREAAIMAFVEVLKCGRIVRAVAEMTQR
jgi:hypothetical protein